MVTPPRMIARTVVEPKQSASPTLLESFTFELQDQTSAEGSLYRWQLQDFIEEGKQLSDGWFLTVSVVLFGAMYHLHQYDSTFFTVQTGTGLKSQPQSAIKPPSNLRPSWRRRSDRWWPVKDGNPLQFIGQFAASGYVGYLFSDLDVPPLIAAYVHDIGEQDADTHYDQEAKRNT